MEERFIEFEKRQNKKFRKGIVLMIVLGLVFGSIAGVTAYTISAKEIGYSPKDTSWKVSNVADAIESLKTNKGGSNNYSTEEQVVGTWIDGKPVYQKTIIISGVTLQNNTKVAHNISNIDRAISNTAYIVDKQSNAYYLPIAMYNTNAVGLSILNIDSSNIVFRGADTWTTNDYSKFCITIQYTKTTDNATNS